MNRGEGLRVFASYSHKDERYLDRLRTHLANLREEGLVRLWHDRAIRPGEEWEPAILGELEQADIIVLLISSDFNDSYFCRQVEMARAIKRHQEGSAVVIPVVVRTVEALPQEIAHIQAIPNDLKPITKFKPQDEGYVHIAQGIRKVLTEFASDRRNDDLPESPEKSERPASTDSLKSSESTVLIDVPDIRPLTVFLEFLPARGGYKVNIQIGFDRAHVATLPELVRLGESERLRLDDGAEATLGELVQRLIDFKPESLAWFEERGQLEIGRKLFDETAGRIPPLASRDQVDLRIVTDDEHLMRVPWPLLNRRGIFLIHEAWSTSLSTRTGPMQEVTLPSRPNVLVINPDPYPDTPTGGAEHLNDLRALLSGEDYDLGSPEQMVEIQTWKDLKAAVSAKPFDVVYYYGHGEDDMDRTRLIFQRSGDGAAEPHSIPELARVLRTMNPSPTLVYVNCCHGDSAGLLGIGNQLGRFVPSVVTNRTVARIAAAQKQACAFFRQVLLDSVPPHDAAASLYRELTREDLDGIQPEWFTPFHHADYSAWNHTSPRDANKPRIHPNWRWLLDRKNQFGTTTQRLRDMANRRIKKRALALVAHGAPGNGLRHFQERIRCFAHESVGIDGKTYKPTWAPFQARDERNVALRNRSFMQIVESCGQSAIPELVRELRHGVLGSTVLTVFNHAIVPSPKILNSQRLVEYLEWWDHQLATQIDDENLFFLFAFYFELRGGAEERKRFRDRMKAAWRKVRLPHIDFELLLPLTEIDEDDLLQFIEDHELFIPRARREEIAHHIIRETGGEYEPAVALLELIVHNQYQRVIQEMKREEQESGEADW